MGPSEELLEAYRAARYEIHLGGHVVSLSCGGVLSGDTSLFFHQPVSVISASNPSAGAGYRSLSQIDNSDAHRCLLNYLARRGYEFYPAQNSAPDGSMAEDSVAVFGLSRDQAAAIGRSFGQAAIFYFSSPSPTVPGEGEIVLCGPDLLSLVRRLPLVDLHIHAEGAIPPAYVLELLRRKGGEDADRIGTEEDLNTFLRYRNFYEFIQKWLWMLGLIRKEGDYADIVFEVMRSLRAQGVVHGELHFSPFDYVDGRLKGEGIVEAAVAGMRKAKTELKMTGVLIADLVRNHPVETGRSRLDSIAPFLGPELVAVGLGGNEAKFPASLFVDAFAYARSIGFRTVAHAGETAGAESVQMAVAGLKAERVGHGLRAMEDSNVVAMLRDGHIPLEVCLTSNEATGAIEDVGQHPIRKMIAEGLSVTLGSDDPTMFHTSTFEEFRLFLSDFAGTADDLRRIVRTGIEAAFMDDARRAALLADL